MRHSYHCFMPAMTNQFYKMISKLSSYKGSRRKRMKYWLNRTRGILPYLWKPLSVWLYFSALTGSDLDEVNDAIGHAFAPTYGFIATWIDVALYGYDYCTPVKVYLFVQNCRCLIFMCESKYLCLIIIRF